MCSLVWGVGQKFQICPRGLLTPFFIVQPSLEPFGFSNCEMEQERERHFKTCYAL